MHIRQARKRAGTECVVVNAAAAAAAGNLVCTWRLPVACMTGATQKQHRPGPRGVPAPGGPKGGSGPQGPNGPDAPAATGTPGPGRTRIQVPVRPLTTYQRASKQGISSPAMVSPPNLVVDQSHKLNTPRGTPTPGLPPGWGLPALPRLLSVCVFLCVCILCVCFCVCVCVPGAAVCV